MKKYIKNSSEEDYFNKLIKRIDEDGYTCFIIQTTGEDDYWYWVVDTSIVDDSGLTDIEFVNDVTGEYGSEGCSTASFDTVEEAESDFRGDNSQSVESTKSVTASAELDDRFDFLLDPEFEIYVGNDRVTCYRVEDEVIDGGAGMKYTIALNVGDNNHWQINKWIERGLEEYFTSLCDGSDYTFDIGLIKQDGFYAHLFPETEILTDMYGLYVADVYVVPRQNISPYGDYGIDAGLV